MASTFPLARREILDTFKAAWDASTPAIDPSGAAPPVFYETVPEATEPLVDSSWVIVGVTHNEGFHAAISNKRFTKTGIVTAQIFAPLSTTNPTRLAEDLAVVVKDAYEGKNTSPSNIWFRRTTINEIGVDDAWVQMNVTSEFEYDEVKS